MKYRVYTLQTDGQTYGQSTNTMSLYQLRWSKV